METLEMFHISKAGPIVHTAPDFPCLPFLCCIRALTSSAAPRQNVHKNRLPTIPNTYATIFLLPREK